MSFETAEILGRTTSPDSPSAPTPAPSSQPLSTRDLDLLTHYLAGAQTPLALAHACGMTLPELLAWRKRPEIDQTITAYKDLEAESFTFAAASARRLLITALSELVQNTTDPVERRRAAQSLLRAINPPSPRSPGRGGEVADSPWRIEDSPWRTRRGDEGPGSTCNSTHTAPIRRDPSNSPPSRAPRENCGAGFSQSRRVEDSPWRGDQPASGRNSTSVAPIPAPASQSKINGTAASVASPHATTPPAAPSAHSAPSAISSLSASRRVAVATPARSARNFPSDPFDNPITPNSQSRKRPSALLARAGACIGAAP